MPIYEFRCKKCEHKFEELCHYDQKDVICPHCGGTESYRLISSFSTVNTGAGGGRTCSSCAGSSCSSCR
ncbi:MAG: zinc ribbon domain-containing protein [Firmicutes bacterium]|nr:zinc ribbon domain-containing protein [Bacillota bacterium]